MPLNQPLQSPLTGPTKSPAPKAPATMTYNVDVIRAYKTSWLSGHQAEEVLALRDGRAVYLQGSCPDIVCESLESALAMCAGIPQYSQELVNVWRYGYTLTKTSK
jgi:hypothetical protein